MPTSLDRPVLVTTDTNVDRATALHTPFHPTSQFQTAATFNSACATKQLPDLMPQSLELELEQEQPTSDTVSSHVAEGGDHSANNSPEDQDSANAQQLQAQLQARLHALRLDDARTPQRPVVRSSLTTDCGLKPQSDTDTLAWPYHDDPYAGLMPSACRQFPYGHMQAHSSVQKPMSSICQMPMASGVRLAPAPSAPLTAAGDSTIKLWDLETQTSILECRGHYGSVKSVTWNPYHPHVFASGSRDGRISIWDSRIVKCSSRPHALPNEKETRPVLDIAHAHVKASELSQLMQSTAKGKSRTPAKFDQTVGSTCYWNVDKMADKCCRFAAEQGKETRLCVYEFDCQTLGEPTNRFSHPTYLCSSFYIRTAVSPDDSMIMSGSSNSKTYIWETQQPTVAPIVLGGHQAETTGLAWNQHDIGQLATCSDDFTVRVWRAGLDTSKLVDDPGVIYLRASAEIAGTGNVGFGENAAVERSTRRERPDPFMLTSATDFSDMLLSTDQENSADVIPGAPTDGSDAYRAAGPSRSVVHLPDLSSEFDIDHTSFVAMPQYPDNAAMALTSDVAADEALDGAILGDIDSQPREDAADEMLQPVPTAQAAISRPINPRLATSSSSRKRKAVASSSGSRSTTRRVSSEHASASGSGDSRNRNRTSRRASSIRDFFPPLSSVSDVATQPSSPPHE
eukprot:jgi/Hompol1/6414/HPOL_004038-RA